MALDFNMEQAKSILDQGVGQAQELIGDPSKISDLLVQLEAKLKEIPVIGESVSDIPLMVSMVKSYITKEYTAEVYGHPPVGEEIALDYYYKKDSEKGRALLTDTPIKGYVPVHIAFRVIEVKAESAVLSVVLHKGKMHQIRAMLARYGYFILGDGKYGSDEINRRLGISKTLLTASAITFSFPQDSPFSYLNRIRISL